MVYFTLYIDFLNALHLLAHQTKIEKHKLENKNQFHFNNVNKSSFYILGILPTGPKSVDCGLSHCTAARCRVGNRFESRLKPRHNYRS